jgi:TIR domain-containing protein/pentapeptide repeat protein
MANPEHLKILKQGAEVWNKWRVRNRSIEPDLSGVELAFANLRNIDFINANLEKADLTNSLLCEANLLRVNLSGAELSKVDFNKASLYSAVLRGTNLQGANLSETDLTLTILDKADLSNANLTHAKFNSTSLYSTNLSYADLSGGMFYRAHFGNTIMGDTHLASVFGLETCIHSMASIIDHRTLTRSGKLPIDFLHGCGLSDTYLEFLPSLIEADQPIKFYSSFISYSSSDQNFANRLYADLQNKGVRCWFAPEEMKGGRKIHEQIFSAIQIYDKLLLVLSEHSLQSEWVRTEIRRARRAEREENRRKLFPIRLVDFDVIQKWECFDADSGKDLAVELREYYIPDFSNWEDHAAFDKAFDGLLRDLKAGE